MSRRMKITLPDPLMTQLRALAANNGEPVSRTAARMVCDGLADRHAAHGNHENTSTPMVLNDDSDFDRHAPWIEPIMGDPQWKARMWGSIVALHGAIRERWRTSRTAGGTTHPTSRPCARSSSGGTGSTKRRTIPGTSWRFKRSSPTTVAHYTRKAAALSENGSLGLRRRSGATEYFASGGDRQGRVCDFDGITQM